MKTRHQIIQEGISIINPLGPRDAIWQQIFWITPVQVIAWCLMAPSHYLNQYWLTINEVFCHSFQGNVYQHTQDNCASKVLEKFEWSMNLLPLICLHRHRNLSTLQIVTPLAAWTITMLRVDKHLYLCQQRDLIMFYLCRCYGDT